MPLDARLLPLLAFACAPHAPIADDPPLEIEITDCPEDMKLVAGADAEFCLDTHEVLAADLALCVEAGHCTAPLVDDGRGCHHVLPTAGRYPANCVDARQAAAYCRWLGKRLPGDVEWLWAAHGGARRTAYPWGDEPPEDRACVARAGLGPCEVGSFEDASPEGIHDLVGSVSEWTLRGHEGGLRGGSWRYRPNLDVDDPRSDRPSTVSGIRCAAGVRGSTRTAAAAYAAAPPRPPLQEPTEPLTLPTPPRLAPTRPPEHLDVVGLQHAPFRRWTEVPGGEFIPFAPADPRSFGLPDALDTTALPADLAACTPVRGLRETVLFACDGRLVAADRDGWSIHWQTRGLGWDLDDRAHFYARHLVVSSGNQGREPKEVYGYSLLTGRPVWGHGPSVDDLTRFDEAGLYRQTGSDLTALDPATGEALWTAHRVCGVAHGDGLIVETDAAIQALDPRTGATLTTLGPARAGCQPRMQPELWIAGGRRVNSDAQLRIADLATGRPVWDRAIYYQDSFIVDHDVVYYIEGDRLLALDAAHGGTRAELTVGATRVWDPPLRAYAAGAAYGPLIVVRTSSEAIVLGRVPDPVTVEAYKIRGQFILPARPRRPGPDELPAEVPSVHLGPHELTLHRDYPFEVSGRRARGARLEFAAPGLTFTPASVVLGGSGTYDLGRVRVQPRP